MVKIPNSLSLYKKKPVKEALSIIGVPFEEGSGAEGLSEGPKYLRKLGLVKELKSAGINAEDSGDIKLAEGKKDSKNKSAEALKKIAVSMAEKTADKVHAEIKNGKRVLAIGGDHTISLGTIAGASRACGKDLGVVWIDAHPDLCTWEESITKNIHGIQAAALIGEGDSELVNAGGKGAKIKKQNILYIGLKDMDPYEIKYLEKNGIATVTMHDILKNGIGYALSKVDDFLKTRKNIWVSLDMDGIEKRYVPSSPMATDEGLSAREVLALARLIGRKGNVVGADIVEFSAKGDIDSETGLLAIDLVAKLFGSDAGWYERYMNKSVKN